jgi:2'-5' RNA ligase
VPLERLGDTELAAARGVFARFEPFALELTRLEEWPGVLWAAPEPADRVRALIEALIAAFPEFPPYEGEFPDPAPHATLAVVDEAVQAGAAAALRARLAPLLPARFAVDAVTVMEEREPERWVVGRTLPLGA